MPQKRKQTIHPPEDGWKPHALYLVDVAWKDSNPIHRAYFFTGFLNDDGTPGGYNMVFSGNYEADDCKTVSGTRYLKPIRLLASENDVEHIVGELPRERERIEAIDAQPITEEDMPLISEDRSHESFSEYIERIGATREDVDALCRSRGMFFGDGTLLSEMCDTLSIQHIEYSFTDLQKFVRIVRHRKAKEDE